DLNLSRTPHSLPGPSSTMALLVGRTVLISTRWFCTATPSRPRQRPLAQLVRNSGGAVLEGDGPKVTETWQVLPAYPGFVSAGNPDMDVKARIDGMQLMA